MSQDGQWGGYSDRMVAVPAPPSTRCVIWPGRLDSDGYGMAGRRKAHVLAWESLNGPVPDGLVLDHLCRKRACVRPDHLEPVTPLENTLRGMNPAALNARKEACPQGHPYDEQNTRWYAGRRYCRTCRNQANAARKARLRAEDRAAGKPRRY